MKLNPKLLIGLGLLLIFGYFLQDLVFGQDQYALNLRKARKAKNESFRRDEKSPLSEAARTTFDSLRYYPANKAYRFSAQFAPAVTQDTVRLATSTGQPEKYLRWGQASFILNKREYKLTLFRAAAGTDTTLFVPFADRTNGAATYGAGRYLDAPLPAPDDTEILLDFNTAYNPYCAYNAAYTCPLPPAENRLNVALPVGEKTFKE